LEFQHSFSRGKSVKKVGFAPNSPPSKNVNALMSLTFFQFFSTRKILQFSRGSGADAKKFWTGFWLGALGWVI